MTMNVCETVSQVAKRLHISESTVKKYYGLIERHSSYNFTRNDKNHVLFYEYDIELLQKVIALKKQPSVTVEQAIKKVIEEEGLQKEAYSATDITVMTDREKEVITVMADELKQLRQIVELQSRQIQQLTETVQVQKEETKFLQEQGQQQESERDRQLMQLVRDVQETKKLVAASKERNWWRFWK